MAANKGHHDMNRRLASTTRLQDIARLQHELAEARQEMDTLYCALDDVSSGPLLLNQELAGGIQQSVAAHHVQFLECGRNSAGRIRAMSICMENAADAMAVDFEEKFKA